MKCYFLLVLFLIAKVSYACTTFFLTTKDAMVFGRNYDWLSAEGILHSNQRGLYKESMQVPDGNTISWTSKYGSLTFNQYGKEFPTGGMNEKGLVVEIMWLQGTQYPPKDNRPALEVLQWVQYQLDNCATVEEVIATDKVVRISKEEGTPLHYLVADANGNAATIEFLNGRTVVHKNEELPFPVLANDRYNYSLQQMKAGQTENTNSLERFTKACNMVSQFQNAPNNTASAVDYSFSILAEVAQGSFTKWRIVYDIKNKKIYFKSFEYFDTKEISFADVNFSCKTIPKSFNINQNGKGNIKSHLINFSHAMNRKSFETAIKETASTINVSEATKQKVLSYPHQVSCKTD